MPSDVSREWLRKNATLNLVEAYYRDGRISQEDAEWYVYEWNQQPHRFSDAELRDGRIRMALREDT